MPRAPAQVQPFGLDPSYTLELGELSEQRARARVAVRDERGRPHGPSQGGVYAAIAESLAALATARLVEPDGKIATPLSLQSSFLEPIADGSINALAVSRHRGRTTWVWEVEISDDRGALCGLSRVTIAVREGSGPG